MPVEDSGNTKGQDGLYDQVFREALVLGASCGLPRGEEKDGLSFLCLLKQVLVDQKWQVG